MRPLKALLIVAVAVGGLGLIARAAGAGPGQAGPGAAKLVIPNYLKSLLQAINTAPTGEEALAAYARARVVDPSSPLLKRAFVHRMVALHRPLEAYEQAAALTEAGTAGTPSPNGGFGEQDPLAWTVVAMMRSKLELTGQSLEAILKAAELGPDDPYVLAAAGKLLGEYDQRQFKPELDEALKAKLEAAREKLRSQPAFAAAYDQVAAERRQAERQQAERRRLQEERRFVAVDDQARREAESRQKALELAALYAPRPIVIGEAGAGEAGAETPGDQLALRDAYGAYVGAVFGDYAADALASAAYQGGPYYGMVVPSTYLGGSSVNWILYLIRTGAIKPGPLVRDGLIVRYASDRVDPLTSRDISNIFHNGTNIVVGPLFPTSPSSSMGELHTYGGLVGSSGAGSSLRGGSGLAGFGRLGGGSGLVGGRGAGGRLTGAGGGGLARR